MINRREWFGITMTGVAALAVDPRSLFGAEAGRLLTRAIPSTGERLPVIGLGSSATFSQAARREDIAALREVSG